MSDGLLLDIRLSDGQSLRDRLKGFERQIPFATALALTKTAQAAQRDVVAAMSLSIDRPTRFTLNSTFVRPATKSKLWAEVGIKDFAAKGTPAARYLFPIIHGGDRGDKRSERAMRFRGLLKPGQYLIPGDDAPLNQHGNLTAGQVVKALSNIGGQIDTYQNTTSTKAKKRQKASGRQYFMMPGKGIFWRQGKGLRSFLIIGRRPHYQKQFDFYGIVAKSAQNHLPAEIDAAIDYALSTAK